MRRPAALLTIILLATGCATSRPVTNHEADALRLELLDAETVAERLSMHRSTNSGACSDQVRAMAEQMNMAARQYFLAANYTHPTTRATALILGRAHISKALMAAEECVGF